MSHPGTGAAAPTLLLFRPMWRASRPARRRPGAVAVVPACEAMESRVVLSRFGGFDGGNLVGALASTGIPIAPVPTAGDGDAPTSPNAAVAQLLKDLEQLRADKQALAAKSGLTIADLTALANDSKAIIDAGAMLDRDALNKTVGELATAVAGGADTTQARADFTALFANTAVAQDVIDQAFADLVQAIQDSGVTTADLQAIATDQANIEADEANLPWVGGWLGAGFGPGPGYGGEAGLGGGLLASALNSVGVVTSTSGMGADLGPGDRFRHGPPPASSTDLGQLQTDLAQLKTDTDALAAKSGLTIADLTALANDSRTIAQAGARLDPAAVDAAITELAAAVVAGTDITQAQADFTALFAGSTVAQATIDQSFADLTKAIQDSKVSTADLQAIATDQANIKADLAALQGGSSVGTGPGRGGDCPGGSGTSDSAASGGDTTSSTGDDGYTVSVASTATATTTAATTTTSSSTTTAATTGKAHVKARLAAAHHARALARRRR